jgi:hypothetical protein
VNRKYQLVLQWPASASADFDALIALEDLLRQNLLDESRVDGHDLGSGEMNIFVLTDGPQSAFDSARRTLQVHALWPQMGAAYREIDGEAYTILWPADLKTFGVV